MTLKMTTAQVVETSVTVTNSSFQNYTHPDDHTRQTKDIKSKVKTERNGPRTKMLLVYVGASDSSNQPKIEIQGQWPQSWHYVEMKI